MNRFGLFAAVCAAAVVVGCAPSTEGPTTQSAVPPETLDGLYVVDWTGTGTRNGVTVDDLRRTKNGWAFRTTCGADGCVATGGGIPDVENLQTPLAAVRVADYVDGRWSMVWVSESGPPCTGADGATYTSPTWSIWDMAVDPTGMLSTTVTLVGTGDCPFIEVHHPIVTKSEDTLNGVPVPDPAEQPARVIPAAAGFTGDYTVTRTPRGRAGAEQVTTDEVSTHCLRDEPRCVTVSANSAAPEQFSVLQFEGDQFTRRSAAVPEPCDGGGAGVAEVEEALRPGGVSAPIRTASGERVATFSAGCGGTATDDVEYALTAQ